MTAKQEWVVGFLFDTEAEWVMLIRKNRPEWQKGKLNGVGGKVEPGENIYAAMEREFLEETGVHLPAWNLFASLTWGGRRRSLPAPVRAPRPPEELPYRHR